MRLGLAGLLAVHGVPTGDVPALISDPEKWTRDEAGKMIERIVRLRRTKKYRDLVKGVDAAIRKRERARGALERAQKSLEAAAREAEQLVAQQTAMLNGKRAKRK